MKWNMARDFFLNFKLQYSGEPLIIISKKIME